jgi:gliding motility-associated-like protein
VNTVSVDRPSIVVDDAPYHIFVAQDPTNVDCADTLYINLSNSQPDTMYVEVPLGETVEDNCLSTIGLPGTPETLTNVCQSSTYNAQLISSGDPCIAFYGISVGTDTYCMEVCDDLGNCIVVTVIVEVTDDGEFEIFNGFSPNEDGINDYFRIKGIERYPENQLTVFNRWGNRVYSQKRYTNQNPWTAEYRNTYLASGSYFYILEVEMDGKKEVFSGLVEVRR